MSQPSAPSSRPRASRQTSRKPVLQGAQPDRMTIAPRTGRPYRRRGVLGPGTRPQRIPVPRPWSHPGASAPGHAVSLPGQRAGSQASPVAVPWPSVSQPCAGLASIQPGSGSTANRDGRRPAGNSQLNDEGRTLSELEPCVLDRAEACTGSGRGGADAAWPSVPNRHEFGSGLAARKYSNRTCQLLLTVCLKDGGEDVISSTAFNQIPIGSEQLRIRQVLE
jgi:hypothetical protein